MTGTRDFPLTASHWGVYRVETAGGRVKALHPFERDPAPSAIMQGYLDTIDDPLRIRAPMVRKAWLEGDRGDAPNRNGEDSFVQVTWEEAERLAASELDRVRKAHGNQAIYGGSYGWSSAGRFHHAQSQLHRFLNCIGGYTSSVNSYSLAAGEVILTHVLGDAASFIHAPPPWQAVIENTDLVVAFGGMPVRNSQISAGGTGYHRTGEGLWQARNAGVSFVNISPVRDDVSEKLGARWVPARPGSDVAIMLGIAHELLRENRHDQNFLRSYTQGFDQFASYVLGEVDGIVKSARWAAELAGISAVEIADLARRMANGRTMISVSWSLTRQEHGEQPFWMATTLAAMLGQIGLPGGGIAFGYGASNSVGNEKKSVQYASLPQFKNPVTDFIPVARISDMLLNPGASFPYNGSNYRYPDIRLVYWAGGNPFHHHQDLTRLTRAWQKPETVIVHDWCWNALAKRADIILPCTTPLERDDLMITPRDRFIVAMKAAIPPVGDARNDHDILCGLSRRLGVEADFSGGRNTREWLEWLYEESRLMAGASGISLPDYQDFKQSGWYETGMPDNYWDAFTTFRKDPVSAPLQTPSGKIEITASKIAALDDATILPHPAWYEPVEWLGGKSAEFPFHLISSQPADKLHAQLDHGRISRLSKLNYRTPVHIHPADAAQLGLSDGNCVRIYNLRGACLATTRLDPGLRSGVVKMSTGAWLDVSTQGDGTFLCHHGNPNVVTRDTGTSKLAQGPVAQSCLVAIERFYPSAPPAAFVPPAIEN